MGSCPVRPLSSPPPCPLKPYLGQVEGRPRCPSGNIGGWYSSKCILHCPYHCLPSPQSPTILCLDSGHPTQNIDGRLDLTWVTSLDLPHPACAGQNKGLTGMGALVKSTWRMPRLLPLSSRVFHAFFMMPFT